jgi:hypothetical protein
MSSVDGAPLADLCRESDPTTVTAFVADLYAARGWTVDRRGEYELVVSDGDRERRVAVVHPDANPPSVLAARADTVVVPDDAPGAVDGADLVDAGALRQQLAYAVDRPVARRLLRSHFGWSPADPDAENAGGDRGADGTDGGSGTLPGAPGAGLPGPDGGGWPLLAVALLVVVAGGVVAVGEMASGTPALTTGSAGTDDSPPTLTPVSPSEETATPSDDEPSFEGTLPPPGDRESSREFSGLPPGVNQSGGIDPPRLASAHRSLLENTSYRLTITNRQFVDDQPAGVYSETVRVVNGTRYRTDVTRRGTLPGPTLAIAGIDTYANGSVKYERVNGSRAERESAVLYDRFGQTQERYLRGFLEVRESAIVDNHSETFYIVTEGNPVYVLENTTGSVVVTESGLVRRAQWTYDVVGNWGGYDGVSGSFEVRVSGVGSTTVREPDWVNRTAG